MFARLIPIRTQHGVRSEIVLLAYGLWDQPVGETVWIDELTRQTARGFISQTAGTAANYVAKSCSLVGEMETKIRNLPQGNLSCKETWWKENGATILNHIWQSLMNTFKNETLNSCCERNFGFTSNESRRKPLIRGSWLSKKEPPSASFQPISMSKQLETN